MSRPMMSPVIGGHELAGGHVGDGAHDPARRLDRDVRQDREAEDDPGHDPDGQQQPPLRGPARRAPDGAREAIASAMAEHRTEAAPVSGSHRIHRLARYQTARPARSSPSVPVPLTQTEPRAHRAACAPR